MAEKSSFGGGAGIWWSRALLGRLTEPIRLAGEDVRNPLELEQPPSPPPSFPSR